MANRQGRNYGISVTCQCDYEGYSHVGRRYTMYATALLDTPFNATVTTDDENEMPALIKKIYEVAAIAAVAEWNKGNTQK